LAITLFIFRSTFKVVFWQDSTLDSFPLDFVLSSDYTFFTVFTTRRLFAHRTTNPKELPSPIITTMHFSTVISVLAVLSATIAAPSPRRHQIETRTHSHPEARQPFNPYHSEHRFAQMAENKKRASNHGRDAMPAVVAVEKKAKRQIKKRGGKCAVRSAAASVTSASSSASVTSASASEYYVASSTHVASSAWVEPSHSASPAAASATLNVQQAAVSSVEASSSSHSSVAPTSTVAPSTTVQATSAAPATASAASESGDWKTGGHATYFYQNGNAGACGWYKSDSDLVSCSRKIVLRP
jgi:hypothetical protein